MWEIVVGLISCMLANVLLGTSLSKLKKEFSKEKMLSGLMKVLFVCLGGGLMYLCSYLNPNILVININGLNVNLVEAMRYVFTAGIVFYGGQSIRKLISILNLKVEVADVQQKETIPVPKENEIRVIK